MPFPRIFMIAVSLLAIAPQAFASDVMDIVFAARNGGSIIFSHQKHLASQAISDNCNVCHGKIYKTKSKRPVTMAEMEKETSLPGRQRGPSFMRPRGLNVIGCKTTVLLQNSSYSV